MQRYVAAVLEAPWDIRLAIENEEPNRPYVLITRNGPALPVGSFGVHTQRLQQPLTVHAYLPAAESREEAELVAAELEETFFRLFKSEGAAPATRADVVPLWDFVNDTSEGHEPKRAHCDYAAITRYSSRSIPDPQNPRLMTTIVDVALSWFRAGTTAPTGAMKLKEVRGTPAPPPRTDV
jgi:hypothetical protein